MELDSEMSPKRLTLKISRVDWRGVVKTVFLMRKFRCEKWFPDGAGGGRTKHDRDTAFGKKTAAFPTETARGTEDRR